MITHQQLSELRLLRDCLKATDDGIISTTEIANEVQAVIDLAESELAAEVSPVKLPINSKFRYK